MSGELIFTFAFGGALIIMGGIVQLFLNKMNQTEKQKQVQTKEEVLK